MYISTGSFRSSQRQLRVPKLVTLRHLLGFFLILSSGCVMDSDPFGPANLSNVPYPILGEECPGRLSSWWCLLIDAPIENGQQHVGWGCGAYDGEAPKTWTKFWWAPVQDGDPRLYPPPPDCPAYWPAPDGNNYTDAPTPAICKKEPWLLGCPCDIDFVKCAVDELKGEQSVLIRRCETHVVRPKLGFWVYGYFTSEECESHVPNSCDSLLRCGKEVPWIPYPDAE